MTDYTQTTDFSAKDSLATGDPNKKIQGADLDGELAAISTAISSKADTTGNANTGNHSFAGQTSFNGTIKAPLVTKNVITTYNNLVVIRPTVSTVDIDVDEILLEDSSANIYKASSVNLTVDITASGVNGLDTGSEASNTWYYLWVIYDGTTVSGLISTSSSSPTMPSGYTYKGLVSAVRNDESNDLLNFRQINKTYTLDAPIQDHSSTNVGASAVLVTLTVPPEVIARISVFVFGATGTSRLQVTETWQTDIITSGSNTDIETDLSNPTVRNEIELRTDSSSQIRYRSDAGNLDVGINTVGWSWE